MHQVWLVHHLLPKEPDHDPAEAREVGVAADVGAERLGSSVVSPGFRLDRDQQLVVNQIDTADAADPSL